MADRWSAIDLPEHDVEPLRYFARANTFSRTPSAFAEFQATTRGTASQAIKVLEARGYLARSLRDKPAKGSSP